MLAPHAMVYGESQLQFLLPGVQEAFAKTRADAAAEGITLAVKDFGGARTEPVVAQLLAWRDAAVKNGEPYYRVSPYKSTKHRYGAALDFKVTAHPSSMTAAQAYARVGALARPHGLLWGGTFSAPADIYHLESQQTLEQLAPRWDAWRASADYPRVGAVLLELLGVLALVLLVILYLLRAR